VSLTYAVALYTSQSDARSTSAEFSWEELKFLLTCHEARDEKDRDLWAPHVVVPTEDPRTGEVFERRCTEGISEVWAVVFDLEKFGALEDLAPAAAALEGVRHVVYTTHGHRSEAPRLRLVVPLSRSVRIGTDLDPDGWKRFYRAVGGRLSLPSWDPTCEEVSRMFYRPACPPRYAGEAWATVGEGVPLDVDDLLAVPGVRGPIAVAPTKETAPDLLDDTREYDPGELSERLKTLARQKSQKTGKDKDLGRLVSALRRGEAIAEPGARNVTLNRLMSCIAFAVSPPPPWDALRELVVTSLAAMDCEPEGCAHWEARAESMYERAILRRAERRAQAQAEAERWRAWFEARGVRS
jgi:hypothetical protein